MTINLSDQDVKIVIDAIRVYIRQITDKADEYYLQGERAQAEELIEQSNEIYQTLEKFYQED